MANQPSPPSTLDASSPPETNVRKRVCKACDRCRLKKSKCDGGNPCGRCKADNAICVFGERKKAHDKVYPKGYVEMLEQQQTWLVTGLQELYRRTQDGEGWPGSPLKETNGHPLTHDILDRLGALKHEGNSSDDQFEEDLNALQQRLLSNGAGTMQRQDSSDGGSDADHSPTFANTRQVMFNDSFWNRLPPTPRRSYSPTMGPTAGPVRHAPRNKQPHLTMYPSQQPQALPQTQLMFPQQRFPPQQPGIQQPFLQQRLPWAQPPGDMMDDGNMGNMEFLNRSMNNNFDIFSQPSPQVTSALPHTGLSSCLPVKQDWPEEPNFDDFLNPDPIQPARA